MQQGFGLLMLLVVGALIILGGTFFSFNTLENYHQVIDVTNSKPAEDAKKLTCRSDNDCSANFSCWFQIPRGPAAGIKGSSQTPGKCIDNNVVNLIQ